MLPTVLVYYTLIYNLNLLEPPYLNVFDFEVTIFIKFRRHQWIVIKNSGCLWASPAQKVIDTKRNFSIV